MDKKFLEGVVEQCFDQGLSLDQTQEITKIAGMASVFDHPEVKRGFEDASGISVNSLSSMQKAELAQKTLNKILPKED